MTTKHTPTPWVISSGRCIGHERGHGYHTIGKLDYGLSCGENKALDEANAAFIVRACNSHDDLIGAMEFLLQEIYKEFDRNDGAKSQDLKCMPEFIRAEKALAKAKGEV